MLKTSTCIFGILFILISYGCSTNEIEELPDANFGRRYAPIEVGKYLEYSYDSLTYAAKGTIKDTLSGYIKEVIEEEYITGAGDTAFKLVKYWKKENGDQYKISDVESVRISDKQLIVSEENISFIKLVFPNTLGTTWDGNALFDNSIEELFAGDPIAGKYTGWTYEITERDQSMEGINQTFEDIIKVKHIDSEGPFELRKSFEIYAAGIGLVKRCISILDTQRPNPDISWEDKADLGYIVTQRLIDHN